MSVKSSLKRSLYAVLQNDNQGSFASRAGRRQILFQLASDLIDLGYKIPTIQQFKTKYVITLTEHWQKKELNNGTIKNRLAAIRHLARMINQPHLIPDNSILKVGSRRYYSIENRAAHQVDLSKLPDPYVRVSAELQRVFGLRREESLLGQCPKAHTQVDARFPCRLSIIWHHTFALVKRARKERGTS